MRPTGGSTFVRRPWRLREDKEGKTLAFSDEGASFRCELDGSHLEAVVSRVRNPQELAFDNHGNLFTGENDCDQGDRERWVFLLEGGDSGWAWAGSIPRSACAQYVDDGNMWSRARPAPQRTFSRRI
jgi:quinoprotein glucose dehydrogenase